MDDLLVERENVFTAAKDKFEQLLRNEAMLGIEQHVDIEVAVKTNRTAPKTIAKEIVDMYDYIVGYSNVFPRAVLAKSCKYVDITQKESGRTKTQIYNPTMDRMKITELSNMVKDLHGLVEKLTYDRDEDRSKILALEQEIVGLQGQVKLLQDKKPGADPQPPSTEPTIPAASTVTEATADIANTASGGDVNYAPHIAANTQIPNLAKQHDIPNARDVVFNDKVKTNGNRPKSTVVEGNDGQKVTVIHRGNSLTKEIVSRVLAGQQPVLEQKREEWPLLPSPQDPGSMSSWQQLPKMTTQKTERRQQTPNDVRPEMPQRELRGLRGKREEKGKMLYVKNIEVADETDEDIGQKVIAHCRDNGIRVMYFKVIRYRTCIDAVGCKFLVPETQERDALSTNMWPPELTVRRWESQDVWYQHQHRERHRDSRDRYSNDDNYANWDSYYKSSY